jgi:hypothetical protein
MIPKKKKIIELRIDEDDDISGIDSISLVTEPAIEVNWLAFKKDSSIYQFVPDGEDNKYLDMMFSNGEPEENLIKDGWVIDSVHEIGTEEFALSPTKPNDESVEDTDTVRIRYKYDLSKNIKQSPIIDTTREYCRTLLNRNYVWRFEELLTLNGNNDINDGGFGGEARIWRGGYNCRHRWFKIIYKKDGDITNKASANKNKVTDVGGRSIDGTTDWLQPSTITNDTLEAVEIGTAKPTTKRNLGLSKEIYSIVEDKRIVLGPAMIPDLEIYRQDDYGNVFYTFFSAETIRIIAEKYMKNKFIDNNDINHDGKAINDVYVVESWIKEDENDKSVKYGYDLPIGTWFVAMKIAKTKTGDVIWRRIKDKELNGFSISGYFEKIEQYMKEQNFLKELENILQKYN